MANLIINGKAFDVDVEPDTPLLWAIRENIGLTGTKYGCGIAQCGACTVHVDGVAMRSCGVLVSEASGKQITTIEGLAADGALHKVQQAWIDNDVPQCGYCQTGMIMAVAALLKEKPKPTDKDIDESITNICRQRCRSLEYLVYSGIESTPGGWVHWDDLCSATPLDENHSELRAIAADTLAAISYTGGTTGLPKGVMQSHANLVANAKHMLLANPLVPTNS